LKGDSRPHPEEEKRVTVRAVLIGLVGGMIICSLSYFNDFVLRQTFLVGNSMPVSVYGTLLVFLALNGLLFRLKKRFALTGTEIAVAMALTLCACAVPGSSLMRTFTVSLAMPRYYNKTLPGSKDSGLVDEHTPRGLLVQSEIFLTGGALQSVEGSDVAFDDEVKGVEISTTTARLRIASGVAKGQRRDLIAYDPGTRTGRLAAAFDPSPAAGDLYELYEDHEDEVVTAFIQGASESAEGSVVPWWAWVRPMLFWVPTILTMFAALIGLGLFVHERWSKHEHLPYPIAQLSDALLPAEGEAFSGVYRDRRFWIAGAVIFVLYMNNYIHRLTGAWLEIPTRIDLWSIMSLTNIQGGARWMYGVPTIYFSVIGIAYFLRSEVSLSVGLAPLVLGLVVGYAGHYGIAFTEGGQRGINHQSFLVFGAFVGMITMIVYEGRHYYAHGLRQAVGLKSSEALPAATVWGARVFVIALMLFIVQLMIGGLTIGIATLYALGIMMLFTVMGRVIAETGLFFIQPRFVISTIIIGIFGPRFLGLTSMIVLMLLTAVLTIDPRETLMPFFINALKTAELRGARVGRIGVLAIVALVLGLAVAIPATLSWQYSEGANLADTFATREAAGFAFRNTLRMKHRIEAQGSETASSDEVAGGGLSSIRPVKGAYFWTAGIAFLLVIGCTLGRMRFPWWPIHPVMFLISAGWGTGKVGFCFLLGWLLKTAVMKYGGTKVYQDLKPVVIGIVAGEFFSALVPVVGALLYYAITGDMPQSFSVFPG
jgi:hypothetical protein